MTLMLIGIFDGGQRVFTRKVRILIKAAVVCRYVWLSPKGKAIVSELRAREQAHWLVGDEHPTQKHN